MSRITIINKGINKGVSVNISKPRELLFHTSIIKFKVTIPLLSCGIRTGRTVIIRVTKNARVL